MCCYNFLELQKGGQSSFFCCHAVFQWLNNDLHICIDVGVICVMQIILKSLPGTSVNTYTEHCYSATV